MGRRPRRNHLLEFKAKVALEAAKGKYTLAELALLSLMKLIDRLRLDYPFAGSRMLRDLLNLRGIQVGRRRVRTLMRRMGIEALYRKPNTSKKHSAHRIRFTLTRCRYPVQLK